MNLKILQLDGMELVDPGADYSGDQVIYLDFKGANDVAYNNEALNIHVNGINVADSGLDQTSINKVITELNTTYAGSGVSFTVDIPTGKEYSTVYVGAAGSALARYGSVLGLSETIDAGNKIKNDTAFVFSDKIASASRLAAVIAHETGHLLGYKHENTPAQAAAALADFSETDTAVRNVVFVTHGYELSKSFPSWVDDMGTAIQSRMEKDTGVADVGLYTLKAKVDNGKITFTGPSITAEDMVIEVDWSSLSGGLFVPVTNSGDYSTSDVAKALSTYLYVNCPSLLSNAVNISLIGHSRGGSLIAALADDFYKDYKVTTDSATFLDPHPLSDDYGFSSSGGGVMSVSNITTSYNYYRNDGSGDAEAWNPPGGWTISASGGTVENVELNNSFFDGGSKGGYGYWSASDQHSDVHLWYQGTVDTQGAFADEDASVSLDQANSWYSTSAFDTNLNSLGLSYDRNDLGYNLLVNPEISVWGKAVVIADGDTSPAIIDGTSFGHIATSDGTVTQEFTIKDIGAVALNLTGTPIISLSNTDDFKISQEPDATVNAGGNTTFSITFDPASDGLKTATVTISSNDADEGTYDFKIQGSGMKPDAGNTMATANDIADPDNWVGVGDACDFYKLTMTNAGTLTLGLTELSGNANLALLNSAGGVLKTSANSGITSEAIDKLALQAGTYYVKITPGSNVSDAYYTLSHDEKSFPTDNAANDYKAAVDIDPPLDNWVGFADAADVYKLIMTDPGKMTLWLTGLSGNADLSLLNAKGAVLKSSAGKGSASEAINDVSLLAGIYYIKVAAADGGAGTVNNTYYTLNNAVDYFPVDTAAKDYNSATDIGAGVDNWVGFGDAADFYKVVITDFAVLTLGLSGLNGNADMTLLDAKGKALKSSANTGINPETISAGLAQGTYYVKITPGAGVNDAAYTLTYDEKLCPADKAGNTLLAATDIGAGADNWVGFGDAADFYKVVMTDTGILTLGLNGLNGNADMTLLDAKGKALKSSANTGINPETISAGLTQGTYYVKVTPGTGVSDANYTMTDQISYFAGDTQDNAGNNIAAAKPIDESLQTGWVGLGDSDDYYRFDLAAPARGILRLYDMTGGNADLSLYDANGKLLQKSTNAAVLEDIIAGSLAAGTYYARVTAVTGNIDYKLDFSKKNITGMLAS